MASTEISGFRFFLKNYKLTCLASQSGIRKEIDSEKLIRGNRTKKS